TPESRVLRKTELQSSSAITTTCRLGSGGGKEHSCLLRSHWEKLEVESLLLQHSGCLFSLASQNFETLQAILRIGLRQLPIQAVCTCSITSNLWTSRYVSDSPMNFVDWLQSRCRRWKHASFTRITN